MPHSTQADEYAELSDARDMALIEQGGQGGHEVQIDAPQPD
jgi:hypothetical protein